MPCTFINYNSTVRKGSPLSPRMLCIQLCRFVLTRGYLLDTVGCTLIRPLLVWWFSSSPLCRWGALTLAPCPLAKPPLLSELLPSLQHFKYSQTRGTSFNVFFFFFFSICRSSLVTRLFQYFAHFQSGHLSHYRIVRNSFFWSILDICPLSNCILQMFSLPIFRGPFHFLNSLSKNRSFQFR